MGTAESKRGLALGPAGDQDRMMNRWAIGLRGKFVLALAIAAALPLLVGVFVLNTVGFRYLFAERGRTYAAEARNLAGPLEQAADGQAGGLRSWIAADNRLSEFAVRANKEVAAQDPAKRKAETRETDAAWLGLGMNDPRMRAVLENPASASLREFMEHHPLIAEVLATDAFGRVIASTRQTSDYDQADEEWWTKGRGLASGGVWSDSLHLDPSAGVYSLDLVMPLYDGDRFSGVVKMVINATPLFGRFAEKREDSGKRLEIVLPDGRILARWGEEDYQAMSSRIKGVAIITIQVGENGWTLAREDDEGERMTGFAGVRPPGRGREELPSAYILISTSRDAVVAPLRRQLLWVAAAAGLAVTLCVVAGYQFVSGKILRPLNTLRGAARAVSATARLRETGDRSEEEARAMRERAEQHLARIETIHTGDEVEELAGDLAVMTSRVLRYHRELEATVAEKTAVIRDDLEMARQFQAALMPTEYPKVPSSGSKSALQLRFAHYYQPTATLGGDFFDLIKLDEWRVAVLIADVMGHGARSALVTAIVQALVRNRPRPNIDPGVFLGEVNQHLHQIISRSGQTLFVTGFLMVLDTRHARVEWAVAGHPAPLRARSGTGRPPQPLWSGSSGQPALGLVPEAEYRTQREKLEPGEVFLLFTDGAVEAENPEGGEFGIDRLVESFGAALEEPLSALPARIIEQLAVHVRGRHYEDDVCLVAVGTEDGGSDSH